VDQVPSREHVQYAGVGWRFAAIAIDTVVLFFLLVAVFTAMVAAGALDLKDPALSGGLDLQRVAPAWMYAVTYGLIFAYYTLFEALTAASVGKLVLRMRVTMDDGTRPSGLAVVVRNLIRLPEVLFWYIPSGISCLANPKDKRLGDIAARTVVVRRSAIPVGLVAVGTTPSGLDGACLAIPHPAQEPSAPRPAAAALEPDASEALAGLKTAALAVRGAHLNYLRFSEVELAKDAQRASAETADGTTADAAGARAGAHAGDRPGDQPEPEYSAEYAAAWYTLSDAVVAMQQAHAVAISAATREGTTLQAVSADQPDLTYLFGELEPYFAAGSDAQVHEAYMRVARGETTA
jgi:uncharacterized RDD family membrane protein YckC